MLCRSIKEKEKRQMSNRGFELAQERIFEQRPLKNAVKQIEFMPLNRDVIPEKISCENVSIF